MKKNTILFILSSGHSGSTILDLAIGEHEKCFSLGEISELQNSIDTNSPCVCGETFSDCEFWLSVKDNLSCNNKIDLKPYNDFCLKPNQKKRSFLDRVKATLQVSGFLHKRSKWITNVQYLYDSIFSVSDSLILVDSSKSLRRALLIRNELKDYDFKFLHLVRDVRGVAYSYNKTNFTVQLPKEEVKIVQRTKDVFSIKDACITWYKYNRKISILLKALIPNKDVKRIRYEDLCSNPDRTLEDVIKWLNLEYASSLKVFSSSNHHNIGGNSSRFNSTEIKHIDEKWRTAITEKDRGICMNKAGFLNRYYGYK